MSVRGCAWVLSILLCSPGAPRFNAFGTVADQAAEHPQPVREIEWSDIAYPIQALLASRGIARDGFPAHVAELRRRNHARLREGDLDHLVYYLLQSSSFTRLPAIEPAESAAEFVGRFSTADRARFKAGEGVAAGAIPEPAKARIAAFTTALDHGPANARLSYFRDLVAHEQAGSPATRAFLSDQYMRAMRFLYEKEFTAIGRKDASGANRTLYQQRGLSSDTSVDAGYLVYLALATLRQLEPDRRIQRVLIIGPGLDLAPRTGLVETSTLQSYQPFAVMDALLGTGLAEPSGLQVNAVDINPRVVEWLRHARGTTPELRLFPGVAETARVHLTEDYRTYFASLGQRIGAERPFRDPGSRRLAKTVKLSSVVTAAVHATTLDITVERVDDRYDLIVATNVFPYLTDPDLLLALSNITRMLTPGGVLLHNEPRPLLADASLALNLPLLHARSAIIATVERGVSPLYDSVWMHRAPE